VVVESEAMKDASGGAIMRRRQHIEFSAVKATARRGAV
jgi:hypothetical protein